MLPTQYQTKYFDTTENPLLFLILKIMIYIYSGLAPIFLVAETVLIITSIDPSFMLPVYLIIAAVLIKIFNLIILYLAIFGATSMMKMVNISLIFCTIFIFLTDFILVLEIMYYSNDISYLYWNPYFFIFTYLFIIDIVALIHLNTTTAQSKTVTSFPYMPVLSPQSSYNDRGPYELPIIIKPTY